MFDAVIIGAGAAGLMAGKALHELGLSFIICEASDRIGGRMRTIVRDGQAVELGAEFVHGRPPVTLKLLKAAGLEMVEGSGERFVREGDHLRPQPEFWDVIERVNGQIDRERDQSYDEFLGRVKATADEKRIARLFVEGFNAADAKLIGTKGIAVEDEASAEVEGERIFRLPRGYQALADWLSGQVPADALRLESVVRAVRWQTGAVRIVAEHRGEVCEYQAARAIITVPLGVLKASADERGAIRFEPPLTAKAEAWSHLHMGRVRRIALRFRERFWERHGSFAFVTAEGLEFPVWWTQEPTHSGLLIGWASGPVSDRLGGLTDAELQSTALKNLARIFNEPVERVSALLETFDSHDWSTDPWTRGAYSYPGVGGIEAALRLAEPIDDTLFFAGEATDAEGANGTVHGALESGLRVAREIAAGRKPQ